MSEPRYITYARWLAANLADDPTSGSIGGYLDQLEDDLIAHGETNRGQWVDAREVFVATLRELGVEIPDWV